MREGCAELGAGLHALALVDRDVVEPDRGPGPFGEAYEPLHGARVVDPLRVLGAREDPVGAGLEVVVDAARDRIGAPRLAGRGHDPDPLPADREDRPATGAGVGGEHLLLGLRPRVDVAVHSCFTLGVVRPDRGAGLVVHTHLLTAVGHARPSVGLRLGDDLEPPVQTGRGQQGRSEEHLGALERPGHHRPMSPTTAHFSTTRPSPPAKSTSNIIQTPMTASQLSHDRQKP